MIRSFKLRCLCPLCLVFLFGCGAKYYATAPTSGKVAYDIKPITQGTITFIPVKDDGSPREGKAAIGTIQSDGTFVLTTYEKDDGAILGKHRVVYSPPEEESDEEAEVVVKDGEEEAATPAKKQPQGIEFELEVAESNSLVDVEDGNNSFMITLDKIQNDEEEDEGE